MFRGRGPGHSPVYVFDTEDSGAILSLMIDISIGGCSLLISKETELAASDLRMEIQPPRADEAEELTVQAVHRWSDDEYSPSHRQIGLQFTDLDDDQHAKLKSLIDAFINEEEHYFRCKLFAQQN